jgi:hypothetical protein
MKPIKLPITGKGVGLGIFKRLKNRNIFNHLKNLVIEKHSSSNNLNTLTKTTYA